ncbi:hypothetical protein LV779_18205 [Streptomyces thinghirensis]|nr:hypothetical protein [Streptomyces thinghirensis]
MFRARTASGPPRTASAAVKIRRRPVTRDGRALGEVFAARRTRPPWWPVTLMPSPAPAVRPGQGRRHLAYRRGPEHQGHRPGNPRRDLITCPHRPGADRRAAPAWGRPPIPATGVTRTGRR